MSPEIEITISNLRRIADAVSKLAETIIDEAAEICEGKEVTANQARALIDELTMIAAAVLLKSAVEAQSQLARLMKAVEEAEEK
jgi:hypothetical protein